MAMIDVEVVLPKLSSSVYQVSIYSQNTLNKKQKETETTQNVLVLKCYFHVKCVIVVYRTHDEYIKFC